MKPLVLFEMAGSKPAVCLISGENQPQDVLTREVIPVATWFILVVVAIQQTEVPAGMPSSDRHDGAWRPSNGKVSQIRYNFMSFALITYDGRQRSFTA